MILNRVLFATVFVFVIWANAQVVVETRDEQVSNFVQTQLRLRIYNGSGDTLRNVELRYFFSPKDSQIVLEKDYLPNAEASIVFETNIPYLKISIPIFAPGVFSDSGGISLGLHLSDWSEWGKDQDFSLPESDQFAQTEKVAVYVNGEFLQGLLLGTLPDAEPVSLTSGSGVSLTPGEKVHFAWREVEGAKSYRLNVLSAQDSSLLLQQVTEENRVDAALDSGEYLWNVEAFEYGKGSASWLKNLANKKSLNRLFVYLDSAWVFKKSLNVTPLAARKDTRLVDVKWGEMAVIREWDVPHQDHSHYDEEENYRCWAVAAQMLNRYYGGNLTQDEIKLKFKGYPNLPVFSDSVKAKILGAFLHSYQGRLGDSLIDPMLQWALGDDGVLLRKNSLPTRDEVLTWIDAGVPLYVWDEGHVMVLDAYRISHSGRMDVRLLNTDNDGTVEWRTLRLSALEGFVAAKVSGNVRMTDSRIHTDSDDDGLMDYDEIERFGTDPNNPDSDGDGIDDKTEIFSYTIREPLPDKDTSTWKRGIDSLVYADIDADGLRAELDFDSDGGGVSDGEEDLNRNGILDADETDIYDAIDDLAEKTDSIDVPGKLTLYAMNHLSVNDGVRCHGAEKNCDVAAESLDSAYAVNVGRSAYVRRIDAKGGIIVRDYAWVTGNVRIFSLPSRNITMTLQNNVTYGRATFSQLESLWPYRVPALSTVLNVGDSAVEVNYGKNYTLKDGVRLKSLKVHSGGTLFIASGEMFVGNVQLESGAKIQFIHPGRRTVLHVNGTVIWRAFNLDDDLEQVAKDFKLIQHGSETMTVEGMWAGTIFAPKANLILGQSSKKLYGRFLGNNVTVHQYATVYHVEFKPEVATIVARR